MAAPVILPDQSAPRAFTSRPYGFGPAAMNSPTLWTTAGTALPPGLTLNTTTGLVSGTPTLGGTYFWALQASNTDGASAAMLFAMEVVSLPPVAPGTFIGVVIELSTGEVTFPAAVLTGKSGDDLLQQIQFVKYGVVQDINDASLKFTLKLVESDTALVTGTSYAKVGTGEATVYRHATTLVSDALTDALETEAAKLNRRLRDPATHRLPDLATLPAGQRNVTLLCLAEYELKWTNDSGIGRNPSIWTTGTVGVQIVRELIPNL